MEYVYIVTVDLKIFDSEGNFIKYRTDEYQCSSLDEAFAESDKHIIGEIEREYSDGAYSVVDSVEVDDEPQEIGYFYL